MDRQPLRFGSGIPPFDQISFGIGNQFGDGGFDFQLSRYHFELTVMMVSTTGGDSELVVFFDGPTAHAVRFKGDGRINARTLGDDGYIETIGEWEPGVPIRLVVDIFRPAKRWTIALDGEEVFSGPYPIYFPFGMRMLRPSSSSRGIIAAIDDVIVSDRTIRFVDIDIKPGSISNPINLMAHGVIRVEILSSDTFDAADVDVTTLAFGPDGSYPSERPPSRFADVDRNGIADLVLHFPTFETGIAIGDTEACLTGNLLDGTPIRGCDAVETLAPPNKPCRSPSFTI
jgi:hypothetical protein